MPLSERTRNREGFTLLEVMLTVAITMILSGTMLAYNRSGENQIAVFKDQAVMVGIINRAKALTQQRLNVPLACAFGIHIDGGASRAFQIFADKRTLAGDPCVSPTGTYALGIDFRYGGPNELISSYELDPRSKFTDVPVSGLNVVFIPPDLTVTSSVSLPTTFKISDESGSNIISTTITTGGQIVTR